MKLSMSMLMLISLAIGQTEALQSLFNQSKYRGIKISSGVENEIIIEKPDDEVLHKRLNYPTQYTLQKSTIDSIGFDVRTLDTSLYSGKYQFWRETPVGKNSSYLIIGDINNNGKPELYGHEKPYSEGLEVTPVIYELSADNNFIKKHQYPNNVYPYDNIEDIDNDGDNELVMHSIGKKIIYKKPSINEFPTQLFSMFQRRSNLSVKGLLFDDFDNNGKKDVAYWNGLEVYIDEFNPSTEQFDTIFAYKPIAHTGGKNFTAGDFDMDGKTDIVFGDINDNVYMIEAQGEHQYQVVWQGKVPTYNAYLNFKTNDIDGNGKPEFWVGGDSFFSGLGMTRFTCFESNGDNSYIAVARIDFIGIFSFFAGNIIVKDLNGDGKEELFICLAQHIFIPSFTGTQNAHDYSLLFAKRNEMADQNSVYYGATLYDITGDGKDEFIVSMDHIIEGIGRRDFSRIYTLDIATSIQRNPELIPSSSELHQNFPNPFNPSTTIRFKIGTTTFDNVNIKIYNILGKEIRELINAKMSGGEYETVWNGTDNNNTVVESGVYFISLQTSTYRKTIKTVFLK